MWTAEELGLDCERLDVGGAFGGTDTADYLSMNPMGLVPTLQDGDTTLFESCAIVRYLGARYGDERFWPRDPAARALLDQWAEWGKGTFARAVVYDVFWTLVRIRKVDRDLDALAAGIANASKLAKMLDQRLGKGPYLAGENLTFADIILGHVLYRYYSLDFERVDTPNLDAYYDTLTNRPAYAEHVMVDYSSLKVE
ncbi:MAG: glutathione S-transferase [Rhizobiaceae bacterium]|nr:glutathione S-transferase [Rhizobiaceae bacterium]